MPETGAVIGMTASIRASVEPQTAAHRRELVDPASRRRSAIVYGKSSADEMTASSARCAERTVAECHAASGLA